MRIGCHCVLFKEELANNPEAVALGISESGADGVEMGARFLEEGKAEPVITALSSNNLLLAGYHLSMPLSLVIDDYEKAEKLLMRGVEFLNGFPVKNIVLTGMTSVVPELFLKEYDDRLKDSVFLKEMAKAYNKLAQKTAASGVALNYHNHNYEFENNALIYNALLEYAPSLMLGLDIGWAASAKVDIVQLIQRNKARIKYVHIRDFKKKAMFAAAGLKKKSACYCDLGLGDIFDWSKLVPLLGKVLGEDGWAVIEYEEGVPDKDRYKKAVAFLKSCISQYT